MNELKLDSVLAQKRRQKGITQEELANYMGVSKASVSKWETGQSYPDILFLPQLAAYFNISVDELMGYEPQLSEEEIRRLYHKLAKDFSLKAFDEVMEDCRELVRRYFSCFPLLLQMCVLYVNHVHLASTEEEQRQIWEEVIRLCKRIKDESGDAGLYRQASNVEAVCEMARGNPQRSVCLMQDVNDLMIGEESILANAYYMAGDAEKAEETIQSGIFRQLLGILTDSALFLILNVQNREKYEEIVKRMLGICDLFEMERLHPGIVLQIYMAAAQGYGTQGEKEQALKLLKKYEALAVKSDYSTLAREDSFFNKTGAWLNKLDLGLQPPRSERMIRRSLLFGVTENPAFACLKEDRRFQSIVETLREHV